MSIPPDSTPTSETDFRIAGLPVPGKASGEQPEDLDQILAAFTLQVRRGAAPSVEEIARRHPQFADELRELLPVIASMEQWKRWREIPGPNGDVDLDRITELGDCEILNEIGRGGMGVVFEARERQMGRRVAVKVLLKKALQGADWRERFQREARIVAQLQHANIVPVYRYGEERGYCYYVMPLVDGVSLSQVIATLKKHGSIQADAIRRFKLSGDGLPVSSDSAVTPDLVHTGGRLKKNAWGPIVRIALQITKALRYAHGAGVLHRDVKPANILLDAQGTVRMTDFGLALRMDPAFAGEGAVAAGTLRYMAPEQFDGVMDVRCDIYALGMTLYELCTLSPAFDIPDQKELVRRIRKAPPPRPRQLNPDIPVQLEKILLKAIRRDPRGRYQTLDGLMVDLRRLVPLADRLQSATGLRRWWLRNFGRG